MRGREGKNVGKISLRSLISWAYHISKPLFIILLLSEFLIFTLGVLVTYQLSFSMQEWERLRNNQGGGRFYSYLISSVILVSFLALLALMRILLRRAMMIKVLKEGGERIIDKIFSEDIKQLMYSTNDSYYPWLTNDLNWIRNTVLSIISSLGGLTRFLAVITLLFVLNVKIFFISIGISLLLTILPLLFRRTIERVGKETNEIENQITTKAHNFLRGYHVFLLANKLSLLPLIILDYKRAKYRQKARLLLKSNALIYLMFIFLGGVNLSLVIIVGYLIYLGTIPLAGALFIESFTLIVFSSLFDFIRNIQDSLRSKHIFERYLITKDRREAEENEGGGEKPSAFRKIDLRDVTYQNQMGEVILKDINLSFKRGKKYAIIGRSGVGKTTLALLILGVLKPTKGRLIWASRDYEDLGEGDILRRTAIAFGHGRLLRDSLLANLNFKEERATNLEVERILGLLNLKQRLDQGETEGLEKLSTGEEQRIKIARILLHRREIIILDEALANLDNTNRRIITKLLLKERDVTLINLTHHLDNKEDYDEVIELR